MNLPPSHWFQHVMSCPEQLWDFTYIPDDLECGQFATRSVKELRQACQKFIKLHQLKKMSVRHLAAVEEEKLAHRPSVALTVRVRKANIRPELFDTSACQLNSPAGTLVQVASNFNCLELPSPLSNPFSGKYLTGLMSDTTQGPSAAAGAGYGAIGILATHKRKTIDLLCDVPLQAGNGKLHFSAEEGDSLDFDPDKIRVGVLTDVRATFDRAQRNMCAFHADGPKIDQVFVSTVILRRDKKASAEELTLSRRLLKAAYDATYMLAVLRQSPKIILTLVGGGSFTNQKEDIAFALASAHMEFGSFLPEACEVLLPIFEPGQGQKYVDLLLTHLTPGELKLEAIC